MKTFIMICFVAYVLIMNTVGLLSMLADKRKAKKNQQRISEKNLLLIAAAGGSFGSYLGMNMFRHKTKHLKFTILVPLCLAVHIFIFAFLIWRFIL